MVSIGPVRWRRRTLCTLAECCKADVQLARLRLAGRRLLLSILRAAVDVEAF